MSMMDGNRDVPIGTTVCSADERDVGEVVSVTSDCCMVERGWLLRHSYTFEHADVDRYEDGVLVLKLTLYDVEAFRAS
jgi:hypothetical protein